jgi:hypothetical protein
MRLIVDGINGCQLSLFATLRIHDAP